MKPWKLTDPEKAMCRHQTSDKNEQKWGNKERKKYKFYKKYLERLNKIKYQGIMRDATYTRHAPIPNDEVLELNKLNSQLETIMILVADSLRHDYCMETMLDKYRGRGSLKMPKIIKAKNISRSEVINKLEEFMDVNFKIEAMEKDNG